MCDDGVGLRATTDGAGCACERLQRGLKSTPTQRSPVLPQPAGRGTHAVPTALGVSECLRRLNGTETKIDNV